MQNALMARAAGEGFVDSARCPIFGAELTGAEKFVRPRGDDLGVCVAYETSLNSNEGLFVDRWTFSAGYDF